MAKLKEKLELKAMINDYCKKKGLSKNELSVQIGVNSAYLSKIENEKFDGITDEVLTKIRSSIRLRMTQGVVYETIDYLSVQNQCETTRERHFMSSLVADTGMGKTTALRSYSMRENVYMVTVNKSMNARRLFTTILREMQISFDGNIHDIILRISEELNRIESPLLIIDEAGKLNHSMLLYLHDLREFTRTNCGILLAGMPYFKNNLEKQSERQKEGCAEFYRRVNIWHELQGLSRGETDSICEDQHIPKDERKGYYNLRFADLMNKISLKQILTN